MPTEPLTLGVYSVYQADNGNFAILNQQTGKKQEFSTSAWALNLSDPDRIKIDHLSTKGIPVDINLSVTGSPQGASKAGQSILEKLMSRQNGDYPYSVYK